MLNFPSKHSLPIAREIMIELLFFHTYKGVMIGTGIFEIKNVQGHLQKLESLRPLKYRKEDFKVTTVYIVLSLDHRHPLTHARYAVGM